MTIEYDRLRGSLEEWLGNWSSAVEGGAVDTIEEQPSLRQP
ncbi:MULTISPECIES: hypothetical protein [Natrialbaceae]